MKTQGVATIFVMAGLALACVQGSCSSPSRKNVVQRQEQSRSESSSSNAPAVDYCEVLRNPAPYLSKEIRITGQLRRFRGYAFFSDQRCIPRHPLISVEFASGFMSNLGGEKSDQLEQVVRGSTEAREGNVYVLVSAVGNLEAIPRDEMKDSHQYRYTITKLEDIQ